MNKLETILVRMKKAAAEIMVVAGMAILLIYILDAMVGQGETGFLPMTAEERGRTFGTSSMILFFVSFGVGYKERSLLLTSILIAGGVLMGTSVLVASAMSEGGLSEAPAAFIAVIIVGYIIMGLGILRVIRGKDKKIISKDSNQ
jgi:hypothetical protein